MDGKLDTIIEMMYPLYNSAMVLRLMACGFIAVSSCFSLLGQDATIQKYEATLSGWKGAYEKPWRRLSNYEMTDIAGKTISGTIEETFVSSIQRSFRLSGGIEYQEVMNESGRFAVGAQPVPYLLQIAVAHMVELPNVAQNQELQLMSTAPLKAAPELDCVALKRLDAKTSKDFGAPSMNYCFEKGNPILRIIEVPTVYDTVFNKIGKFRGSYESVGGGHSLGSELLANLVFGNNASHAAGRAFIEADYGNRETTEVLLSMSPLSQPFSMRFSCNSNRSRRNGQGSASLVTGRQLPKSRIFGNSAGIISENAVLGE